MPWTNHFTSMIYSFLISKTNHLAGFFLRWELYLLWEDIGLAKRKNILRKNPNEAFGQHSTSCREKYLLIEKSWRIPDLNLSPAKNGKKKSVWLLTCCHKSLTKGTALLIKSQRNKMNHLKRIKEFQSKGRWMWEESKRESFLLWGGWVLTWLRQPLGSLLQGPVTV